ncbi:hypothetical protein [Enhygromyxa salina]|uniref:Uncharacterized protein n=1 Tax=Enhygromyxa salina TaxID=215803 RepID=A0A2S9YSH8_9BACT|nr:hypothetical protein [Enhygromyxa salina]PRQ08046.1 hypothetical protein ENSA7_22000 [Enhygromyxa salina]
MAKLTQQLTALRESLRDADGSQSDSFSEVFSDFLAVTETSELLDVCKPFNGKTTRVMLEEILRKHANDPKLATPQAQMQQHPPSGLIHGMIAAGRYIGTFFYFPDEQQGIVAFGGLTPVMHYYRITATEVPPGTVLGRQGPGAEGQSN